MGGPQAPFGEELQSDQFGEAPVDAGYITVAQVDTDGNKTLRTVRRTDSASKTYLDPVFFNPVYGSPSSSPRKQADTAPSQATPSALPPALPSVPIDQEGCSSAQLFDIDEDDVGMSAAMNASLAAALSQSDME